MKKNVKTGFYINKKEGKKEDAVEFNFYTNLRASDKLKFINSVVGIVVDGNQYNSVIKDMIFDYMIISVFTDIDTTEIDNSNNAVDMIEDLLIETNVVNIVKNNVEDGLIEELNKAVDDNIEYLTGVHKNSIADSLSNLLNTIQKKVSEIDTDGLMNMAQMINGISGDFSVEKVLDAYAKSDIFKKNHEQLTSSEEVSE